MFLVIEYRLMYKINYVERFSLIYVVKYEKLSTTLILVQQSNKMHNDIYLCGKFTNQSVIFEYFFNHLVLFVCNILRYFGFKYFVASFGINFRFNIVSKQVVSSHRYIGAGWSFPWTTISIYVMWCSINFL